MLLIPSLAAAEEARPLADNPQVEARLKALAVELRCLVCQNQTLADSNAPLAEDLRREVREMIAKDMSDKEIIDFLVAAVRRLCLIPAAVESHAPRCSGWGRSSCWEQAQRDWCLRCAGDRRSLPT